MTDDEGRPRFIADSMLGSLARWLRMLGYDTVYEKDISDESVLKMASEEGRHIITRDRDLAKRPDAMLLESEDLEAQLKAVSTEFGLSFDESRIRCSACNGPLVDLSKDDARSAVPEGAWAENDSFWKCDACGKVYWKGSHWHGIMDRFRKLNLV